MYEIHSKRCQQSSNRNGTRNPLEKSRQEKSIQQQNTHAKPIQRNLSPRAIQKREKTFRQPGVNDKLFAGDGIGKGILIRPNMIEHNTPPDQNVPPDIMAEERIVEKKEDDKKGKNRKNYTRMYIDELKRCPGVRSTVVMHGQL